MSWGSPVEREVHRRIKVSIWAYAYEFLDISLVPDHVFDEWCKAVYQNRHVRTGKSHLDCFFERKFVSFTGIWVRNHPELGELEKRTIDVLRIKRISL